MLSLFKNLRFSLKLTIGFGVLLSLMVIQSVFVYKNVGQMVESSDWVNHTYEVIRVAESVQADMIDMETGQRGYMITGQNTYLEPYDRAIDDVIERVERGQMLTSDNAAQGERWAEFLTLKQQWISEVAEPEIAARKDVNKGIEAVKKFRAISARTVGKDIFDSMRATLSSLGDEFSQNTEGRLLVVLITLDLVNMETGQRGFLLTGRDVSLEPFDMGQASFKENLAKLKGLAAGSPEAQVGIARLETQLSDWIALAAQPEMDARREMSRYNATTEDIALMMRDGSGKVLMDSIRSKISEIVDDEERLIDIRSEDQVASASATKQLSLLGTLAGVVFGALIGVVVTRAVVGQINNSNDMIAELASGNLSKKIEVESTDELGNMGKNLNAFSGRLKDTVSEITDATNKISFSAQEMSNVTLQTCEEVNYQKLATEQVATAVTQMSATVQEVAVNAAEASEAARQADQEAREGGAVVNQAVEQIEILANEVEASSRVITKLKTDSVGIGSVVDTINGIAEQTNLLALNAAIEAARAGEQGRGFAVVADEVRKLAQLTQESTSEIETMISSIQDGAKQSEHVLAKNCESSRETVEQAALAVKSLDAITTSVEKILQMNTNIAAATEEQSSTAEEISRSVVNIQKVAEKTDIGAKKLTDTGVELADLGVKLQERVAYFKV